MGGGNGSRHSGSIDCLGLIFAFFPCIGWGMRLLVKTYVFDSVCYTVKFLACVNNKKPSSQKG